MTRTDHPQSGAGQKADTAASSPADLEDRYQCAKERLLAASDAKLVAMQEFLAISSVLGRLPKTPRPVGR